VETIETIYKPIASVDQTDIEFLIPADSDTYIDPNIHLFIRGKLVKTDGDGLSGNRLCSRCKQCYIPYSVNVQFR